MTTTATAAGDAAERSGVRSRPFAAYRRVLAIPGARSALLLGLLVRIPLFGGSVVLTLHVVQTLGRGYGAAGLVTAVATVAGALSSPWRGRLLDRLGLRRTLTPSLVVTAACWSIAPFVGYRPLLPLAALAGLFVVPTFSVIRQAVMAVVPDEDRRTALSLDAVGVELSFIIGPLLGVWAATTWPTSWVLFTIEMAGVLAGLGLWVADPAMSAEDPGSGDLVDAAKDGRRGRRRPRRARMPLSPALLALFGAAAVSTVILSGCDVALVAALRHFDAVRLLGPTLALWGAGSVVGGLVYGALHRPLPVVVLLGGLGVLTVPLALAPGPVALAALCVVAGLFCAPTLTATVEMVSRIVPARVRGEAMGWHGSSMTTGSALGAPLAGAAIDRAGFGAGFGLVAGLGILATLGLLLVPGFGLRRDRHGVAAVDPVPADNPDDPANARERAAAPDAVGEDLSSPAL